MSWIPTFRTRKPEDWDRWGLKKPTPKSVAMVAALLEDVELEVSADNMREIVALLAEDILGPDAVTTLADVEEAHLTDVLTAILMRADPAARREHVTDTKKALAATARLRHASRSRTMTVSSATNSKTHSSRGESPAPAGGTRRLLTPVAVQEKDKATNQPTSVVSAVKHRHHQQHNEKRKNEKQLTLRAPSVSSHAETSSTEEFSSRRSTDDSKPSTASGRSSRGTARGDGRGATVEMLTHEVQDPRLWGDVKTLRNGLRERYQEPVEGKRSDYTLLVTKVLIKMCLLWAADPSDTKIPTVAIDHLERCRLWAEGADQSTLDAFDRRVLANHAAKRYRDPLKRAEATVAKKAGAGGGAGKKGRQQQRSGGSGGRIPDDVWSKMTAEERRKVIDQRRR